MLSSKNSKGTKLSASGSSHTRVGVNKAAAAKTSTGSTKAAPRTASSARTGGSKLPKIIILVVVIIIAGGAWWFLGRSPAQNPGNDSSAPALPNRAEAAPQLIEYVHNDIQITYKTDKPFEGTYLVLGYNSWEQNLRRFSDGHISLMPLDKADELRKKYGNLIDADGTQAGMQAIRDASINMPYIYNNDKTPDIKPELRLLESEYEPGRYITVTVKGQLLSYEKGSLNGRDMPAPQEQSGAAFYFVNFEEFKVVDTDW